jgi:hypothetical protein
VKQARHTGEAGQGKAHRQGKSRQGKATQGKAARADAKQGNAREGVVGVEVSNESNAKTGAKQGMATAMVRQSKARRRAKKGKQGKARTDAKQTRARRRPSKAKAEANHGTGKGCRWPRQIRARQ